MPTTLSPALPRTVDCEAAARLVRADFVEMPGLQLSLSEASRLWSLDLETCRVVLQDMVDTRFLIRNSRALFSRA